MIKIAQIQFVPWDKSYFFDPGFLVLKKGDQVIVRTELGLEMGKVLGVSEMKEGELAKCLKCKNRTPGNGDDEDSGDPDSDPGLKPIERKATLDDLNNLVGPEEKRLALKYAKIAKERYRLPMKFVDAHFAFDGSRLTFSFIADGRVDFRELVKDLTRHFSRTIRLQQIGIRDEARIMGDVGHCGQMLCCRTHLKDLASITSEMAELQQCSHRGSDRISGVCGRLLCCLAYEQAGYEELRLQLPAIGEQVSFEGKTGTVIGHQVLKQAVRVEIRGKKDDEYSIVEVPKEELRKKRGLSLGRRR